MGLLDFILNLAGLLLWLNWRYLGFLRKDPTPAKISLVGTLKSTQSQRVARSPYLIGLGLLLFLRVFVYFTIGSNLGINLVLPLGLAPISFNPRLVLRMFLYSGLSFLVFVGVFYFWLLLFSVLNQRTTEPDACLRLIRQHLGWWQRRPVWVRCLIPGLMTFVFWMTIGPLLENAGLFPVQRNMEVRCLRALIAGVFVYRLWILPLIVLLILFWASNYVYFGDNAFWNFVSTSGRNLIGTLGSRRLQIGKLDFTPLLWIAGLWYLGWAGRYGWFCGGSYWLFEWWIRLR